MKTGVVGAIIPHLLSSRYFATSNVATSNVVTGAGAGFFKEDRRSGQGSLTSVLGGGWRYEGSFKGGKQCGPGKLYAGSGMDGGTLTLVYEGGFRNNKKHGLGR
jgi:hypothetical protein